MRNVDTPQESGKQPNERRMRMNRMRRCALSERDSDFLDECLRIKKSEESEHLNGRTLARMAAKQNAPSYYLSFDYAMRIINDRERLKKSNMLIRNRNSELMRRVNELSNTRHINRSKALCMILESGASRFFMSDKTAERLYYRYIAGRKKGGKEK